MDTRSSTPNAPAMAAKPGRVTVHCWSRVRSVRDCKHVSFLFPFVYYYYFFYTCVGGCHNVIAKIAAKCGAVSHHDIGIKTERRIDYDFILFSGKQRRQPAALAAIGEQKDGVMLVDQRRETVEIMMKR